jgi:hypothetical protein
MIRAACHCTEVRLEIEKAPSWVLDCNCTLCRRYGALWAYYKPGQVSVVQGAGATDTYVWGDKMIAFHRCKACGCIVYMTALDADPPRIFGVNTRMMPTLDPAKVPLRQIDNSHSGFFWTKSDAAVLPGQHPKMDAPGPEDWR